MKNLVLETDEDIRCTKCGGIATKGTVYDVMSQLYYCDDCKNELDHWGSPKTIFSIRRI